MFRNQIIHEAMYKKEKNVNNINVIEKTFSYMLNGAYFLLH